MKRTTVAFFCLALLPMVAAAQQRVALREGLIIHPARPEAYVMTPEGGIAAIELTSGAVLWQSDAAAKPLALNGNILVSQVEPRTNTNRLELVALNVQQRGAVRVRNAIDLPPGVRVSIGETLLGTFIATGRPSGGDVIVTWRFVPEIKRGRDVENRVERPAGRQAAAAAVVRGPVEGAVRMNVSTGAVTRMSASAMTPPASSTWTVPPRSGIAAAAEGRARQFESADQRHRLASERIADDRQWQKYRWTVFDAATGQRLGETRSHLAFAPFVVRDGVLVFETTPYVLANRGAEPAKLRGVELATGAERWSVLVREVVYRGPMDP